MRTWPTRSFVSAPSDYLTLFCARPLGNLALFPLFRGGKDYGEDCWCSLGTRLINTALRAYVPSWRTYALHRTTGLAIL